MTGDEMKALVARGLAFRTNPFKELRAFMRAQPDDVLRMLIREARRMKGKETHGRLARTELRQREGRRLPPRGVSQRCRSIAAAWLRRHGLRIGDMVDVTNRAGRTFTGRLVDVRHVLGHIALDGDPHFAFSMLDARVVRSRRRTPGRFVSGIPRGPLDWAHEMTDYQRKFRPGGNENGND